MPSYTYARVRDEARRGSAALARSGVQRGDRVAILSENRVEWALADWACLCAGVVDVPIYGTLPAAQVSYILKDSGASLAFVSDAEQLEKVRAAAASLGTEVLIVVFDAAAAGDGAVSWDDFISRGDDDATMDAFLAEARRARPGDVATMIYTSGTTGTPKGVMLTHNNVASNVWATEQLLEVGPGDVSLSFLPLSHVLQRMVDYMFFSPRVHRNPRLDRHGCERHEALAADRAGLGSAALREGLPEGPGRGRREGEAGVVGRGGGAPGRAAQGKGREGSPRARVEVRCRRPAWCSRRSARV